MQMDPRPQQRIWKTVYRDGAQGPEDAYFNTCRAIDKLWTAKGKPETKVSRAQRAKYALCGPLVAASICAACSQSGARDGRRSIDTRLPGARTELHRRAGLLQHNSRGIDQRLASTAHLPHRPLVDSPLDCVDDEGSDTADGDAAEEDGQAALPERIPSDSQSAQPFRTKQGRAFRTPGLGLETCLDDIEWEDAGPGDNAGQAAAKKDPRGAVGGVGR